MEAVLEVLESQPDSNLEDLTTWLQISEKFNEKLTLQYSEALKNEFYDYILSLRRRKAVGGLADTDEHFLQRINELNFEFIFSPFMGEICRTCLGYAEDMINIFDLNGDTLDVFRLLMSEVSHNDGFSEKICAACLEKLNGISMTLLEWKTSQIELKKLLSIELQKVEEDEEVIEECLLSPLQVEIEKFVCEFCSKELSCSSSLKIHLR